jgi:hypothetical protein
MLNARPYSPAVDHHHLLSTKESRYQMATGTEAASSDLRTLYDAGVYAQHQQDDCLAVVEAAAAQQSKAVDKKAQQKAQVGSTHDAMLRKNTSKLYGC